MAAARSKLPDLPANYADQAIAKGQTVADVRSELLTMMSTDYRAMSKANMREQLRQMGLVKNDSTPVADDPRAASKANMVATLKRMGLAPRNG